MSNDIINNLFDVRFGIGGILLTDKAMGTGGYTFIPKGEMDLEFLWNIGLGGGLITLKEFGNALESIEHIDGNVQDPESGYDTLFEITC